MRQLFTFFVIFYLSLISGCCFSNGFRCCNSLIELFNFFRGLFGGDHLCVQVAARYTVDFFEPFEDFVHGIERELVLDYSFEGPKLALNFTPHFFARLTGALDRGQTLVSQVVAFFQDTLHVQLLFICVEIELRPDAFAKVF